MIDKSEMIFGVRAVIEAIQAGKDIDKILVKKDIQSDLSKELFAALKGTLIPVQRVPVERINRFTRKNHQGVIAFVSAVTYQKTEDLVPFLFEEGKNPLFVMLDGITDVRNFGAVARTCECAAVDAVIIPAKNSVTVNADAVKTSAGALHTLPVCREQNLKDTFFSGCQNGRFHGNSHFPITISCRFTALHRLFRLPDGFVAVFHAMLIFPDSITCLGCDKQSGNPDIRILYFLCNIQQFSDFPVQ